MAGSDRPSTLSDRQHQVLELLDRRVPIKLIAAELDISPTRVNQHIAALKRSYEAASLPELVARYREQRAGGAESPLTNSACTKNHLSDRGNDERPGVRVLDGQLVLSDAATIPLQAPWARTSEPIVVPGMLDGDHAVVRRLAVMLGLAVAIMAAVILTISAAVTIGNLFEGVAEVPVEEARSAG